MNKLLTVILTAMLVMSNIVTVEAREIYYEPTHIVKWLESKGCTFSTPPCWEGFADYNYKVEGKDVKYTNTLGYLRGIAYMYDTLTHVSDDKEFVRVAYKDFDDLVMTFEIDVANRQEFFIEAFMLYCTEEEEFKKVCNDLYDYIKNNVMAFVFTDVSENSWYRPYVEDVYYLGLMTGATDTLFKPNSYMTRGMIATVLHRMEGSTYMDYFPFFADLENNKYYTQAVVWCYSTGIIKGYNDCTFRPDRKVTREEMVTMLYNFARYKNVDVRGNCEVIARFKDYEQVSAYAKEPMEWAVQNGIISGKDNGTRIDPKGNTTRAECSKMLAQIYRVIY